MGSTSDETADAREWALILGVTGASGSARWPAIRG
jgi:hypothetical protein